MNHYFIDGIKVFAPRAQASFVRHYLGEVSLAEIAAMWAQCQISEEARDEWLPGDLEILSDEAYRQRETDRIRDEPRDYIREEQGL